MHDAQEKPNRPRGHRIALDLLAKSASRTAPSFVAKPGGAPIYHGFQEVYPADSNRWALWVVSFPHPVTNHEMFEGTWNTYSLDLKGDGRSGETRSCGDNSKG